MLPPRWFARPGLAAAAALASALLVLAAADRRAALADRAAAALMTVQATDPDPVTRAREAARALALLRASPDVAATRRLSEAEVAGWLAQAGVAAPERLPLPAAIEARIDHPQARARLAAALVRRPGLVVDQRRDAEHPGTPRRAWMEAAAAAALAALAAGRERRPVAATMAVLRQLGATGAERAGLLLAATAGSAAIGAAIGAGLCAHALGPSDADLAGPVAVTVAVSALALLPALGGRAERRR